MKKGIKECQTKRESLTKSPLSEWSDWNIKKSIGLGIAEIEMQKGEKMRIQEYRMILDADGRNILVKEDGKNYPGMKRLENAEAIARLMRDVFEFHRRAEEFVYIICLNTKCRPIGFFEISHGTCNMTLVSPREILIRALLCGAASIIIVHNHPSGDPSPSREDDQMTRRLRKAADLIGIDFLDHIIIGEENYYSYSMNKRLEDEAGSSFVA